MNAPKISGYHLERVLAQGESATLWLAKETNVLTHSSSQARSAATQHVVLKVGDTPLQGSLEIYDQYFFALKTVSKHPGLVTVIEGGLTDENHPFLVLEPCLAANLENRLLTETIPLKHALPMMIGVGSALEHLHHAGLLHRAVSPSHILTTDDGRAVLTCPNFPGIARTGRLSPEELRGKRADERSDVYGLGVTIWEIVGAQALPVKLQTLLASAVTDDPANRLNSVHTFVSELQSIEAELGLPRTDVTYPTFVPAPITAPVKLSDAVNIDAETRLRIINVDDETRLRTTPTWQEQPLDAHTRLRDRSDGATQKSLIASFPTPALTTERNRVAYDPSAERLSSAFYKAREIPASSLTSKSQRHTRNPDPGPADKPVSARPHFIMFIAVGVSVLGLSIWGIMALIG